MNKKRIIILAFLGGVLLCWMISGILYFARGKVQANAEKRNAVCTEVTDATIIRLKKFRKKVNDKYVNRWKPVYEYYVDDVRYEKESTGYYKNGVFEEGEQLEICYNPDAPKEMYVPAEETKDTAMVLTIIMVAFFFAGFVVLGIMFLNIKKR